MNAFTHSDPELAEKLKGLSRHLGADHLSLPPRRRGGAAWTIFVVALLLAGFALFISPVKDRLLAGLRGLPHRVTSTPDTSEVSAAVAAPPAPALATANKAPAAVRSMVSGAGHVVALDEAVVTSKRAGTIVDMLADVGETVSAGQVLLRLEDPEARFAKDAAEVALKQARLVQVARQFDADEAENASKRSKALAASGVVNSQTALDAELAAKRAMNLVEQSAAAVVAANIALDRAMVAFDELTIRAPISGIVTSRGARKGETILAQIDARSDIALFTITDTKRLAIDVDIAETSVAAMHPGLRGEATLDGYPDQPFQVAVTRVAPSASAERGTVSIRLEPIAPPSGIRPDMAARVSLKAEPVLESERQETEE